MVQSRALGAATLRVVLALALPAPLAAQQASPSDTTTPPNTLSAAERAAGWKLLFDGKTTDGWRNYQADSISHGWQVVHGELTRVRPAGDIITRDQYANFELSLEWKISEGGNSGIFYRVSEDDSAAYWSGPEMQVLDDARHPDGKSRLTSAGADYAIYPSPAGVVKPAGQWNRVRIVVNGNHVEHWLNGVKVVDYELGSADWEARVKASKFAPHVHYGRNATGYIGLQDHGDQVAYRSIKIRVLP
ncbi:MAG TPA: DUF1080 domain-containing protein [Gemmatimonadales bacterium]|nr:DUF1080 domain-containing protein [Gemmatimonadales bacterium]